jgi:branched-chain amino acid transport system substrate-binding protein
MSNQGFTTMTAIVAIVCLAIGAVIGIYAIPSPSQGDTIALSEYNALKSDYDTLTSDYDDVQTDLDDALAEIEDLKAVGLEGEVKLGFLASMTGPLATFGENEKVAGELAVKEVNELLAEMGADWTLVMEVEDTQTTPDLALEKTESFAARGIKLLIGPLSSGEVRAIKGYCDANGLLAISQSSTAPDLAIADDNIFRFCPTDKLGQGPALARIMYDDGKRYVIPITRNDAWGVGLEEAATARFTELGGQVLEGIRYSITATEFSMEVSNLASKVSSAIDTYGADKVAVWMISFEECTSIITSALEYDILSTVTWYGSDGNANSAAMIDDLDVAAFSASIISASTIYSPTQSPKFEVVRQNNMAKLGREPDAYSYGIYDVVWAYAYSLLAVDTYDADAVKAVLPDVTRSLFGASGWIDLDEAGDRKAGNYDIWEIQEIEPGIYKWVHRGTWIFASDSIV